MDVTNADNPRMVLSGDDNLTINGIPVRSGILELSANTPVSWTATRHGKCGNIVFADNSVAEESPYGFQQALQQTGLTTNRLAIP